MKFTNLVVPINICEIGEIVRLSRSQQACRLVKKSIFSATLSVLGGTGYVNVDWNRNVHRKID